MGCRRAGDKADYLVARVVDWEGRGGADLGLWTARGESVGWMYGIGCVFIREGLEGIINVIRPTRPGEGTYFSYD
jgi:hypothetical protein